MFRVGSILGCCMGTAAYHVADIRRVCAFEKKLKSRLQIQITLGWTSVRHSDASCQAVPGGKPSSGWFFQLPGEFFIGSPWATYAPQETLGPWRRLSKVLAVLSSDPQHWCEKPDILLGRQKQKLLGMVSQSRQISDVKVQWETPSQGGDVTEDDTWHWHLASTHVYTYCGHFSAVTKTHSLRVLLSVKWGRSSCWLFNWIL